MPLFEWKKQFETGIASIDHEHKELIGVINDLYSKLSDGCPVEDIEYFLGEIHALIEAHFALEEKIMRDTGYAEYTGHKEDHDRLLEDIRDIMEGLENETADFDLRPELAERINNWFANHFSTKDRHLHKMIKH